MTIACNITAIAAADRPRYLELSSLLRSAIQDASELADGYSFALTAERMDLLQVAEWIGMERRCCPFLTFELLVSGRQEEFFLKLMGPEGVKGILEHEFLRPH